jgi:hypothetical protein
LAAFQSAMTSHITRFGVQERGAVSAMCSFSGIIFHPPNAGLYTRNPDRSAMPDALAKARQIVIAHLKKENRLESVQFIYLIDATRKFALPLLDYLDRIGVTKRSPDNTRFLGPKA